MILLLNHPAVVDIDCNDCKRRLYSLETGKPVEYRAGPSREIRYHDGPSHKPPCVTDSCPKGSPELAPTFELTSDNRRVLAAYFQHRATGWRGFDPSDEWAGVLFAVLDGVFRDRERKDLAAELSRDLAGLILAATARR